MTPKTPETDKAEYEVHLGRHRRLVVRPDLCRRLERDRDEARATIADLTRCHHDEPCTVVMLRLFTALRKLTEAVGQLPENANGTMQGQDLNEAYTAATSLLSENDPTLPPR